MPSGSPWKTTPSATSPLLMIAFTMDPAEFMRRAGRDMIYLLKSNTWNTDHGTPRDVREEVRRIRHLHREYPGIIMYRGGHRKPECVQAFDEACRELLVYT